MFFLKIANAINERPREQRIEIAHMEEQHEQIRFVDMLRLAGADA